MTDTIRIPVEDRDPIKILSNNRRPGLIIRQGPVGVFIDLEVCDVVIDAMCSLVDQIESEVSE